MFWFCEIWWFSVTPQAWFLFGSDAIAGFSLSCRPKFVPVAFGAGMYCYSDFDRGSMRLGQIMFNGPPLHWNCRPVSGS